MTVTADASSRLPPVWGAAIWFGIFVIFTLSFWADKQLIGTPEPIAVTAWSAGGIWLVYGVLALPALTLYRRFRGTVPSRTRTIVALLVAGGVFHLAAQFLFVGLERWVAHPLLGLGEHPWGEHLLGYTARRTAISVLAFAGIVGFVTGREALLARENAIRRAAQLEAAMASARLDALRGQLQPHFLFNALNAVAAEIRANPRVAEGMVDRLARLLRASLASGAAAMIPLREELALTQAYLELQVVRFSDRLRFTLQCPQDLGSVPVPALLLQPLVENAVRHGIEPLPSGGTVSIAAQATRTGIELEIADDGVGLPPSHNGSTGIGIANVQSRLETHYRGEAEFKLLPRDGGGTRVIIVLPTPTLAARST